MSSLEFFLKNKNFSKLFMPFKCNDLNENKPSTGLSVLDVWAPVGGNTGEVMELF